MFNYFQNGQKTIPGIIRGQNLKHQKKILDMSSVTLNGSHTPAKRGDEVVGYQGQKKIKDNKHYFPYK